MTSIQDKFFRQLDLAVAARNHELVTKGAWANTGEGFVQPANRFTTVSIFKYDFQSGYAIFTVNGQRTHASYAGGEPGNPNVKTLAQVIDAILAPVPIVRKKRTARTPAGAPMGATTSA